MHAWTNPGSYVATIGASGAVAGLMGAFLSRYPTMKIEMIWIFGIFRSYRFKAAAYWLLPAWLLMEVFYGSLFGASSGVAHWAHVGGFVFGAVVGFGIRKSGLEHVAEQGIQEKIAWVSHPLLAEANEQLEHGKLDEAAANIKKLLAEKPALKIIYMSGYSPDVTLADLRLGERAHFLAKPFDREDLQTLLAVAFNEVSLRQDPQQ